jgi:hypothetical protein
MRRLLFALIALSLLAAGFTLTAGGQEKRDKRFMIWCHPVSRDSGHPQCDQPFSFGWYYGNYDDGSVIVRDFAMGVLVPVSLIDTGDTKLVIEAGDVSWADFVTLDVRKVDLETEGTSVINGFRKPKSAWKTEVFHRDDESSVLMKVEFDDPSALEKGEYVFLPKVDFAAMAKALPDLTEENHYGRLKFEEIEFHCENFLAHAKFDLKTPAGRRNAIDILLCEVGRMYGIDRKDLARRYMDRIFEINPHSVAGHATLAGAYYYEKDVEKALASMLQAVEVALNNRDADVRKERHSLVQWFALKEAGYLWHCLRSYDEAEFHYVQALEMMNDRFFDPGIEIDDYWGGQAADVGDNLEKARNRKPVDEYKR